MKHFKYYTGFFMLSFLILACEKVDFKTQGELIAEELKKEVSINNINKCSVFFYTIDAEFGESSYEGYSKVTFKISNAFLIVEGSTYNLDNLYSWKTFNDNGEYILMLYFNR